MFTPSWTVASTVVLFRHLRDSGKAVKIGHSCAAVSHHRPNTAPSEGAGKANRGSHPGEGEGRGKAGSAESSAGPDAHAESEYLVRGHSFVRRDCARRIR